MAWLVGRQARDVKSDEPQHRQRDEGDQQQSLPAQLVLLPSGVSVVVARLGKRRGLRHRVSASWLSGRTAQDLAKARYPSRVLASGKAFAQTVRFAWGESAARHRFAQTRFGVLAPDRRDRVGELGLITGRSDPGGVLGADPAGLDHRFQTSPQAPATTVRVGSLGFGHGADYRRQTVSIANAMSR